MPIDASLNTIFSLGYYGWGNHAERLVELIDQSEKRLGFESPIYVDIRFRRAVRAINFQGDNFAKVVGKSRYQHFRGLGNASIGTSSGRIKIADPEAAGKLFEFAQEMKEERRRVIYFCACREPYECHRNAVSKLLAAEAINRSVRSSCIEWPGGDPEYHLVDVDFETLCMVKKGRAAIPLPKGRLDLRVLPCYSILELQHKGESIHFFTGRAIYKKRWCWPNYGEPVAVAKPQMLQEAWVNREDEAYGRF